MRKSMERDSDAAGTVYKEKSIMYANRDKLYFMKQLLTISKKYYPPPQLKNTYLFFFFFSG